MTPGAMINPWNASHFLAFCHSRNLSDTSWHLTPIVCKIFNAHVVWNFDINRGVPNVTKVPQNRRRFPTGFYATLPPVYATLPNLCHSAPKFNGFAIIWLISNAFALWDFQSQKNHLIYVWVHDPMAAFLPYFRQRKRKVSLKVIQYLLHLRFLPHVIKAIDRSHMAGKDLLRSWYLKQSGVPNICCETSPWYMYIQDPLKKQSTEL